MDTNAREIGARWLLASMVLLAVAVTWTVFLGLRLP
jgi:hypothetical protein